MVLLYGEFEQRRQVANPRWQDANLVPIQAELFQVAHLSQRLGLVDEAFVTRLTRLIQAAGLPVRGPALGADRYIELMGHDKKAEGGEIRFVVIDGPGRAAMRAAPDALVREVLATCCD